MPSTPKSAQAFQAPRSKWLSRSRSIMSPAQGRAREGNSRLMELLTLLRKFGEFHEIPTQLDSATPGRESSQFGLGAGILAGPELLHNVR